MRFEVVVVIEASECTRPNGSRSGCGGSKAVIRLVNR